MNWHNGIIDLKKIGKTKYIKSVNNPNTKTNHCNQFGWKVTKQTQALLEGRIKVKSVGLFFGCHKF